MPSVALVGIRPLLLKVTPSLRQSCTNLSDTPDKGSAVKVGSGRSTGSRLDDR
jgi:hypothetical protein